MRRRIIISLGLLLAVCLFGDVMAMLCLNRSIRLLSDLAESHRIQSMRDNLVAASVRVELDMLAHLAGHGQELEHRVGIEKRLETAISRCKGCHHSAAVQDRLDRTRETFDAYQAVSARFLGDTASQDVTEARQEGLHLANQLVNQATDAADLARAHLIVRSDDVAASVDHAWFVLSATLVAALIFGGFVALQLKRRLTAPVESLLDGIERVRQGDVHYQFPTDADAEFRDLARALNQAYRDLNEAHESMLQAEKLAAVGKLAAGVAHEVSNPLASISSIAQVMRRHCDSDERAEQLDLIMSEIARISRVLRELLTFSRPASAERRDRLEVNPLLEHAAKLLEYDKRARSVEIVRECESDLPVIVGDSDRLLLVFTNIIINAIDAMAGHENGQSILKIMAQCSDAGVAIRFQDTGPGMNPEQIAQAFEPFFTTKEPGRGTGLGLWICYQTVQKHNGRMRIESRPGKGTTVHVELPAAPPDKPSGS